MYINTGLDVGAHVQRVGNIYLYRYVVDVGVIVLTKLSQLYFVLLPQVLQGVSMIHLAWSHKCTMIKGMSAYKCAPNAEGAQQLLF